MKVLIRNSYTCFFNLTFMSSGAYCLRWEGNMNASVLFFSPNVQRSNACIDSGITCKNSPRTPSGNRLAPFPQPRRHQSKSFFTLERNMQTKFDTLLYTTRRWILSILTALCLLPPLSGRGQDGTINISALISSGEIPALGCDVTGVEGFSPFELREVEGGEATAGEISIYGMKFVVTSAHIITNHLLVAGMLEFAQPVPIPGTTNKTFKADEATLRFNGDGFDAISGGTICFAAEGGIPLGKKVKLQELCAIIETTEKRVGGRGTLEMALGAGKNPCDPTANNDQEIEVGVLLKNKTLERIDLSVAGLMKPLGSTGAFLNEIHGALGFEDDLWFVEAGMVINVGCPLPGTDMYPVTMLADGKITSALFIEITGAAAVFDVPVSEARFLYSPPLNILISTHVDFFDTYIANCEFQLNAGDFSGEAEGILQIPNDVPLVGGWQVANTYAAIDNEGFKGSFDLNVSPEIPPLCVPRYCPPRIPYWKWYRWKGWRKRYWQPSCTPAFCTPRIPAVSAHVGFEFNAGSGFVWAAVADPMAESWELAYNHEFVEPGTGNRMRFMSNYSQRDKISGSAIQSFASPLDGLPETSFTIPANEQNVIFRLTYSNTNAPALADLQLPGGAVINISDGLLPHGFPTNTPGLNLGAFSEIAIRGGSDSPIKEAYFSLPQPLAGSYTFSIGNSAALGDYSVEHLRQNIPPTLTLNSVASAGGNITVDYSSAIEGTATTRIYLCQQGENGTKISGARYIMGESSETSGTHQFVIPNATTNVNSGFYRVAVRIDDPDSTIVEVLSDADVYIENPQVPEPVSEFVTLARDRRFDIAWMPNLSTNIAAYVIRYTAGNQPVDFEFQKTVSFVNTTATVDGLKNGQPYLVTVVAVNTDGYQSQIAPVTRVVPTEGFGLSLPAITCPAHQTAAVGNMYVHKPQTFWADADINKLLASALLPIDADQYIRQLGDLIQNGTLSNGIRIPTTVFSSLGIDPYSVTNLVDAIFAVLPLEWELIAPPAGMTIDSGGLITWTPGDENIGEHFITVQAALTNDLPGAVPEPYVTQTYSLTVVPAKYANTCGLSPQSRNALASPSTRATSGRLYACAPILDSSTYALELLEGPPGMSVKRLPDPRTLQVVTHPATLIPIYPESYELTYSPLELLYWDVPANAVSQRIRIRAVPHDIPDPTDADCLYQDFYLTVANSPSLSLESPFEFNKLEFSAEGVGMTWIGEGSSFRVERSDDLKTWTEIGTSFSMDFPDLPAGINLPTGFGMFLDTMPSPSNAFYRIKTD